MNFRQLTINNFDELLDEMDRLHIQGYTKLGNWNLAQISNHCHYFMKMYLDGYPPEMQANWLIRYFIGRPFLKSVLKKQGFKPGTYTPQKPLPSPELDETEELEAFANTIQRFSAPETKLFLDNPFFGKMTPEEVHRLQLIHCTHHLKFLVPHN
jgi:hypothetical protein